MDELKRVSIDDLCKEYLWAIRREYLEAKHYVDGGVFIDTILDAEGNLYRQKGVFIDEIKVVTEVTIDELLRVFLR